MKRFTVYYPPGRNDRQSANNRQLAAWMLEILANGQQVPDYAIPSGFVIHEFDDGLQEEPINAETYFDIGGEG